MSTAEGFFDKLVFEFTYFFEFGISSDFLSLQDYFLF
jgi:hypothetical protein